MSVLTELISLDRKCSDYLTVDFCLRSIYIVASEGQGCLENLFHKLDSCH